MNKLREILHQIDAVEEQQTELIKEIALIGATSLVEQQHTLLSLAPSKEPITKDLLLSIFGNYQAVYEAYKTTYNIKCKKGWDKLLPLIQDLDIPQNKVSEIDLIKDRLSSLEEDVDAIKSMLTDLLNKPIYIRYR